ncbi:glycosyl hydrolase 5 family protein-like isoform X3 [Trifolium pratense]|uniref:glycosyl hydrolase 5 family protein-like isoform X3 n=1 Tax=Trifolium pratense TaxID=57577 RepID=UPI001E6980CC|nr:glycosyl hydrolase 5 family protein-like isoform X3 [Trifolium pratense]
MAKRSPQMVDRHFDPQEWIQGLNLAAEHFNGHAPIVAMSLRNELRGPRQNVNDWYNYMSQAALAIHKSNPNVLVVISGLNYDTELQFLRNKPLNIDLGSSVADDRFLTCLQTYLVGNDLDWGLWAFQGGYYVNVDKVPVNETFGVLDDTWLKLRYPNFTNKFQLLQRKNQDPTSKLPNAYILYHPLSGNCAQVNNNNELEIGSCANQNKWTYNGSQILFNNTSKCLTSAGEGFPVSVSDNCQSKNSSWQTASLSKLHLATVDQDGKQLCLQDSNSFNSSVVASKCICINDDSLCLDDPQSQWFQLVATNV